MTTPACRRLASTLAALALAGCTAAKPAPRSPSDPGARILALADEYVAAWFDREPLEATESSWPAAADGKLPDRSPAALAAWHARQDAWLEELRSLPVPRPGTPAA